MRSAQGARETEESSEEDVRGTEDMGRNITFSFKSGVGLCGVRRCNFIRGRGAAGSGSMPSADNSFLSEINEDDEGNGGEEGAGGGWVGSTT